MTWFELYRKRGGKFADVEKISCPAEEIEGHHAPSINIPIRTDGEVLIGCRGLTCIECWNQECTVSLE